MADEFASNVEAQNALSGAARKTSAYNALVRAYGPISGDPEALKAQAAMQEYGFKEQENPLTLRGKALSNTGQELANTGTQQANEYNALANPEKLTAMQQENTFNAAANPERVRGLAAEANARAAQATQTQTQTAEIAPNAKSARALQGAEAANAAATAGKTGVETAAIKAQQQREATMGILAALSDTADAGGDVGAAFDKYAPQISQMEGVDQAHIAPLRKMLVDDPHGAIEKIQNGIMGGALAGGATGKAGAAATPLMQRAQQVSAMQVTQQRAAAVPDAVNDALALVPKMSSIAVVRKAKAVIPGTAEYQFDQALKQVTSNLSLDDLRSLRTSGLSLGRVNLAEFTASASAFANMDLGQDPKVLANNLQRLGRVYGTINDNLAADIKRMSVGIPGINKTAAPQKQQQTQYNEGQTYQDAQGNKATYRNGKFEAQ